VKEKVELIDAFCGKEQVSVYTGSN